jgi:hypothetical protein
MISFINRPDDFLDASKHHLELPSQDKHLPEPVVKDRKNYQLLSLERKDR